MTPRRCATLAAVSAATVLLGLPSGAPAATTKSLKKQLAAMKKSRDHWKRTASQRQVKLSIARDEAFEKGEALKTANEGLAASRLQASALTTQVGSLQTQVTQLQGAVPDQVKAVAARGDTTELQTLVLNPARAAWACGGSAFFGSTFFSYDFNRPPGNCF